MTVWYCLEVWYFTENLFTEKTHYSNILSVFTLNNRHLLYFFFNSSPQTAQNQFCLNLNLVLFCPIQKRKDKDEYILEYPGNHQ